MGEVIHGEYNRWVNGQTLHSVTDYALHKALYSGHNDHNYFEIAHTVNRSLRMAGGDLRRFRLYSFVDNHDVERIYTKLWNKAHFVPVHVLLYTLPGIPSVYYGSEFGIEGVKHRGGSDDAIRPALDLAQMEENACSRLVAALGQIRQGSRALAYGGYQELLLRNRQYAFAREIPGERVLVTVNCDDSAAGFDLPGEGSYVGALHGERVTAQDGRLHLSVPANGGEIWLPETAAGEKPALDMAAIEEAFAEAKQPEAVTLASEERPVVNKPYEEMSVEELQGAILDKMARNGPVTDYMRRTVLENTHPGSLLNWVKSFR